MGFYDAYKARLSVSPPTPRSYNIDLTQRVIANTFYDSPSYYQVKRITQKTAQTLDCWIVSDSKTKELKNIQAHPNQTIDFGDYIIWKNEYWLTLIIDSTGEINTSGQIQKCISTLKWLDSDGLVKEEWFTYRLDFYRGAGVNDDKVITMPSERRYIYVQKNEDTLRLRKGQRFIFDGRPWKLTAIDGLLSGLIYFELEEDEFNSVKDNLELGIADYYNNVAEYSVTILNGNYVSFEKSQTLQLNVEVKNRGVVIDSPTLFYSVSDDSIATINESGLISPHKKGHLLASVTFKNVSTQIEINITETVTHNYTAEIVGDSSLKVKSSKTYSCIFRRNGEVIPDKSIFSLTSDDGISPTDLAVIVVQDQLNNTCTIKAGEKTGYIWLHVRNDNGLTKNKIRIQLKPLF
ncbi:hypothetical protein [Paenibacillus elgii]|uniref:hypothetical protein n=1 Tax=Paenibacillus elgii TaxID=189691 RepID=UPI000248CFED|nr:hypothetical protein [Paenibacillus elgii]